jgi:hypothetical protein
MGGMAPAGSKPGTWAPKSLRNRDPSDAGPDMRRRDENSVRVSNLSEDTREDDLVDLFGRFGPVQRVFIARDRETGERTCSTACGAAQRAEQHAELHAAQHSMRGSARSSTGARGGGGRRA